MLRSRVALAVIGVLIFGGIAAALGAASAYYPGGATGSAPTSVAQTASPPGDATGAATPTSAVQASPTATATRAPRPTSTRPPVGVVVDLHGEIGSVDTTAGTFVLHESGGVTDTVQMSAQTQCEGSVSTCAGLQPGMVAEVKGSFPSADAAFQAILVNAQLDK